MQLGLNLLDLKVPPEIPNFQKQKEKKIQSPAEPSWKLAPTISGHPPLSLSLQPQHMTV
jgi:hypothetical protein